MTAMGHIVVGVDETPQAAAAFRWAAEEAAARGWRLTAVLAWDLLSQHHAEPAAPFDPHYSETDGREALDAIIERAVGPERAESVERRVVCDLPAHALLDVAGSADLLVVGSRDVHGIRRALSGSVSARCRRHPSCPMVIVHNDGRIEPVNLTKPSEGPAESHLGCPDPRTPSAVVVDWQIVNEDVRSPADRTRHGEAHAHRP